MSAGGIRSTGIGAPATYLQPLGPISGIECDCVVERFDFACPFILDLHMVSNLAYNVRIAGTSATHLHILGLHEVACIPIIDHLTFAIDITKFKVRNNMNPTHAFPNVFQRSYFERSADNHIVFFIKNIEPPCTDRSEMISLSDPHHGNCADMFSTGFNGASKS